MSESNGGENNGNGNVMRYFIQETNRRLENIEEQLNDLQSFKAGMMFSSKIVAAIISVIVSLATGVLLKVVG